nr:M50 family metallopeptidase [Octadecabacter dasysiphoniae]
MIVLTAMIYALWGTDVIWPLRVLVVVFHEISHAAAALLTGGSVESISFSRNEGGVAWTRGGNGFVISTAGYLGSLLIGAGLFLAAVNTRADRGVAAGVGALLIAVSVIYIRDLFPFVFAALLGGAIIGMAWKLPAQLSDLSLRVIGFVSMLYVPWDIITDTIFPSPYRGPNMSDAERIATQTGLTEGIVGILWLIIALAVIFATLRIALRHPSNIVLRARPDSR